MIAVIELGGNQFNVKVGDVIESKKIAGDIDSTITTDALLVSDEEWTDTKVWTPFVTWVKIECKILDQFKGTKVRVFKMHAKKRYMKNVGFRPTLTKLEILSIG